MAGGAYDSLLEMAGAVRAREISALELTKRQLARSEELNHKLNAFVKIDHSGALEQARAVDSALVSHSKCDPIGVLCGVPLSTKSSIDVAGLPCECGTRLRKGYTPAIDAPLVARLRAAGAIILGNTNVPEFLMAYETDNLLYGRTNNPWDLSRTPGGSSGGEAAAIASGCSAGGIGSDGGGSVRVPAHFTGICALKPTPGRIPSTGHYPASAGPFAPLGVVGPMARTVRDLQLLFEVVAGPDPGDPCAAPVPLRSWAPDEIRKLRVAYFEDDGVTPVTSETVAAVRSAVEGLRLQGFQIEEWRPVGLERIRKLWWNLFGRAGQMAFEPVTAGHEGEFSPMYRQFQSFVAAEPSLGCQEFLGTLLERDAIRAAFLAKMEKYPILICPVTAIPAFRHGEREWVINGKRVEYLDGMSYSQWFNLLGNPAAVIPVGKSSEGLPIGIQIVGRPWEEEAVLAVAANVEQACGGFRCPPLFSG